MKRLFLLLIPALMPFSCKSTNIKKEQVSQWDSLLLEQGIIKVYEPLRAFIAETDSTESYYDISLVDIEKYHGKVCPGIATGFQMFREVLEKLYPNSVPVRGQVAVACSKPNDMLDVASFILGIRNFYGRSELGKGLLVVDTTLSPGVPKEFVMIFKRLDNGKTLKVTFDKYKLMNPEDWPLIDQTVMMFEHHEPIPEDQLERYQKTVHNEVMHILTNGPREGVYKIEEIDNYTFEFENKN